MSSFIVLIIFYLALIAVKSYLKKNFSEFESNRPGQTFPPQPDLAKENDEHLSTESYNDILETTLYSPHKEEYAEDSSCDSSIFQQSPASLQMKAQSHTKEENITDNTTEAIHLQTPTEARRAFIYSEIFNRKYN